MNEHHMITRRRSRSKTPFLRSACDHENCDHVDHLKSSPQHQKKKIPAVETIIEEIIDLTKTASDEKESNVKRGQSQLKTTNNMSTSSSTTTTKFITTEKLRETVNTSTPKDSYLSGSFTSRFGRSGNRKGRTVLTESAQNDLNSQFEITCKLAENSLKNKSVSSIFNESAINTDLSAHPAYLEYKLAGEYWEKTPKTDYTYSYLSSHRRPLTNGYVGMPNMSRRSIYTDQSSYYDSADEVDYLVEKQCQKKAYYNTGSMQTKENWLMRLITIITTITTTTWDRLVGTSSQIRRHSNIYTTDVNRKGVLASIGERITSTFRSLIHYTYLSISNILCMDTWLLRSSNVNNKGRKRFLLFLLCLLPLLLLIGLYYYLHPNDAFPPKSFTDSLTLPSPPQINLSEYFNREQYEYLKAQTILSLENARSWTDEYVLYLKKVTENMYDEGKKLFQNTKYFERV